MKIQHIDKQTVELITIAPGQIIGKTAGGFYMVTANYVGACTTEIIDMHGDAGMLPSTAQVVHYPNATLHLNQ